MSRDGATATLLVEGLPADAENGVWIPARPAQPSDAIERESVAAAAPSALGVVHLPSARATGACGRTRRPFTVAIVSALVAMVILAIVTFSAWWTVQELRTDLAAAGFAYDALTNITRWQSTEIAFDASFPTLAVSPRAGSGDASLWVTSNTGAAVLVLDATADNVTARPVSLGVDSGTARVVSLRNAVQLDLLSATLATRTAVSIGSATLSAAGGGVLVVANASSVNMGSATCRVGALSAIVASIDSAVLGSASANDIDVTALTAAALTAGVLSASSAVVDTAVLGGASADSLVVTALTATVLGAGALSTTSASIGSATVGALALSSSLSVAALSTVTVNADTVYASRALQVGAVSMSSGGPLLYVNSANASLRIDAGSGSVWASGAVTAPLVAAESVEAQRVVAHGVSAATISATYGIESQYGAFGNLTVGYLHLLTSAHPAPAEAVTSMSLGALTVTGGAVIASANINQLVVSQVSIGSGELSVVDIASNSLSAVGSGMRIQRAPGAQAIEVVSGLSTRLLQLDAGLVEAYQPLVASAGLSAAGVTTSTLQAGAIVLGGSTTRLSGENDQFVFTNGQQAIVSVSPVGLSVSAGLSVSGILTHVSTTTNGAVSRVCTGGGACGSLAGIASNDYAGNSAAHVTGVLTASRLVMVDPATGAPGIVVYNNGWAVNENGWGPLLCGSQNALSTFAATGITTGCTGGASALTGDTSGPSMLFAATSRRSDQRKSVRCEYTVRVATNARIEYEPGRDAVCSDELPTAGCVSVLAGWSCDACTIGDIDVSPADNGRVVRCVVRDVSELAVVSVRTAHLC